MSSWKNNGLFSFFLKKIALVDVDPQAFYSCYNEPFPLCELNTPQAVADTIQRLVDEEYRRDLETQVYDLIRNHHEAKNVGAYFLDTLLSEGVSVRKLSAN